MSTKISPSIVSVMVRGRQVFLVSGSTGFLTENGLLKTFSTIEDAKKFCGGESRMWPDEGTVDLEFAKNWISASAKPSTLEVLNKLIDVDAVYLEIHLAYSDYKPEDVPPDLMNEFRRSHEATFSGKRDPLIKLSNFIGQHIAIKVSKEKGWDTEKLIQGWGGKRWNEWTQEELSQLGNELALEIEFIENTLQKYGA